MMTDQAHRPTRPGIERGTPPDVSAPARIETRGVSTTALIEPSQPTSTHKPLGVVCGCSRTPSWFLLAHDVDEVFAAHARAHEPKRLELLPYDERGLSIEADLSQSVVHAIDWFDEHLRRAQPFMAAPSATEVREPALRPEFGLSVRRSR
jgi:hypothetical protein